VGGFHKLPPELIPDDGLASTPCNGGEPTSDRDVYKLVYVGQRVSEEEELDPTCSGGVRRDS
jgi:hypothetical protein